MKIVKEQIIKIPEKALKRGVVVLDLKEYQELLERAVPVYYLKGKRARDLDRIVEEGEKEYRKGKLKPLKSLADLR